MEAVPYEGYITMLNALSRFDKSVRYFFITILAMIGLRIDLIIFIRMIAKIVKTIKSMIE